MTLVRFTETGLDKLKPPPKGKRLDLRDTIVTGLALRVTSNNVKTWRLTYRSFDKKKHHMTIGRYPAISITQARDIARNAILGIAQGNDPISLREKKVQAQQQAVDDAITVETFSKVFVEQYCKPKNRQWQDTESVFQNHINPALGHLPAKDITKKDVNKLLDRLKASPRPHAANHVLVALRKMYNWAVERDELLYNPCIGIKKPVATKDRERVLLRDEIIAFWAACEKIGYPYGRLAQILLLTGQRLSEIANLQWHEVDLDAMVIRLNAEKTKAKRSHEVPLSDFALSIFQSLPRHSGPYIFSTKSKYAPADGFSQSKDNFQKLFQADDWRWHDLRRTAATSMAQLGVPIHTISRILNHAEGGVTRIYARYSYANEKRHALNLWAQHLSEILTGQAGGSSNVVKLELAG